MSRECAHCENLIKKSAEKTKLSASRTRAAVGILCADTARPAASTAPGASKHPQRPRPCPAPTSNLKPKHHKVESRAKMLFKWDDLQEKQTQLRLRYREAKM